MRDKEIENLKTNVNQFEVKENIMENDTEIINFRKLNSNTNK